MKHVLKLIIITILCLAFLGNLIPLPSYLEAIPVTTVEAATKDSTTVNPLPLIIDSDSVDYMSCIPDIVCSDNVKSNLDIKNPQLSLKASSAILISTDGTVLYHKNATKPIFPGSTAKLLTALVALDWCQPEDQITVGYEVKMIAEDSSKAGLKKGEEISFNSLLSAMLLPSGNDAAYVVATYVGRKSLHKSWTKCSVAIKEFVRLMNEKALELGAENSCFITPDGYDAIGQFTTAYDMGRIGLAAGESKTILKITRRTSLRVTLNSGEKLSWDNTNALLNKSSIWYNSNVIGLKTGTTEMAGRCLISAARNDKDTVISVVMNSTSDGRWNDSNKLLNFGLKKLE